MEEKLRAGDTIEVWDSRQGWHDEVINLMTPSSFTTVQLRPDGRKTPRLHIWRSEGLIWRRKPSK